MKTITEMKQDRATLVAQGRALLDDPKGENGSLSAEQEEQYNRIMADVQSMAKDIQRREQQEAIEADLDTLETDPVKPEPNARAAMGLEIDGRVMYNHGEEYRAAFWGHFRHGKSILGPDQYKALNVGSDTGAGYWVPDEFERRLVQKLEEENIMRQLATIIQTASGDRQIPIETDKGEAHWTGEEQDYTASDPTAGAKFLGAHKVTRLMKISEELLFDNFFDLESYVVDNFGRTIGDKEEAAFVNGDGVGKPKGVVPDAEVGKTAAAVDAVTTDELRDLKHSLRRPYRRRAVWLAHDNTWLAISKLKDGEGRYVWQPGLQADDADVLLGRPIATSDDVPEMATGNRAIAFGDMSFYWIADRRGRFFQRLGELYAESGRIGFRAYQRVDGRLTLEEAVKVLAMA